MAVRYKGFLSGNVLKIIAAVAMVFDHIAVAAVMFGSGFPGSVLFSQADTAYRVLRIIGRLSFPIFAFFIAEGCRHTSDRKKYFLTVCLFGLIIDAGYYIFAKVLEESDLYLSVPAVYLNIFTTFSLSILVIYGYDATVKSVKEKDGNFFLHLLEFVGAIALAVFIHYFARDKGGYLDYGFAGALLPLFAYMVRDYRFKVIPFAIGCVAVSAFYYYLDPASKGNSMYWYMLCALPLLALYNGERGRLKMKDCFYLFYPAHLGVVYLAAILIGYFTSRV